jgi:molybdate transport system substrate-binding protein
MTPFKRAWRAPVLAASVAAAFAAALAAGAGAGLGAQTPNLVVSAASSLTDALNEIRPEAERRLGLSLLLNYGGSGGLRAQIEQGAPADVFFSAAAADMDKLEKAGLIVPGPRRDLLANAIVLVGDSGLPRPASLAELRSLIAGARIVAIGNPDSVPAGRYGVEALKTLGLYGYAEGKLALGGRVREVLQFVESGSAPLGIVFKTDAMGLKPGSSLRILYDIPANAVTTPIIYPVAVVAASRQRELAGKLVEFLAGPFSAEIFRKAGFVVR